MIDLTRKKSIRVDPARRSACAHARRLVALVQLVIFLPACTSWRVEPTSPADVVTTQHPNSIRVTRPDQSHLTLEQPEVRGDTLYGIPAGPITDTSSKRTGIALTDVQEVSVRRSDPTRTTLFVAALAVGSFSVLCFLADAFGCGPEESFLTD